MLLLMDTHRKFLDLFCFYQRRQKKGRAERSAFEVEALWKKKFFIVVKQKVFPFWHLVNLGSAVLSIIHSSRFPSTSRPEFLPAKATLKWNVDLHIWRPSFKTAGVHRSTNTYESFLVEILELVIGARLSLIYFLQPFFIHFDMSNFCPHFYFRKFWQFS